MICVYYNLYKYLLIWYGTACIIKRIYLYTSESTWEMLLVFYGFSSEEKERKEKKINDNAIEVLFFFFPFFSPQILKAQVGEGMKSLYFHIQK